MSDLSLRVGTLALLAMLVLAAAPVDAGHGNPTTTPHLQISGKPDGVVNGAPGQSVQFTVTNAGQDKFTALEISTAQATEYISLVSAAASGWTMAPGDPIDTVAGEGHKDQATLTPVAAGGGLAVGASLVITLTFDADEVDLSTTSPTVKFQVLETETGATPPSTPNSFTVPYKAPSIVLSKTDVTVAEPAGTETVTVKLSHKPSADVNIDLTVTGRVTVSPATLKFTATNFATTQTITIKAVDDATDSPTNGVGWVTLATTAAAPNAYKSVSATVSATVVDDEGVGFTLSKTQLSIAEKGATADTFSVVLTQAPTADVTLSVTIAATGTATAADVTLTPATALTFTPQNWASPQTVSVKAVDDAIVEGDETLDLVIAPVPATTAVEYDAVPAQTVTATIADDDTNGLIITETGSSTEVNEAGATTDTFTVKLASAPSSKVVIDVTGSDGQLTISPKKGTDDTQSRLTFTSATWNTAQTITVKAIDDADHDGHVDVELQLAVVAGLSDDTWDAMETVTQVVRVLDNEKTVMARPGTLEIEEGESAEYEISLTVAPSEEVVVAVENVDGLTVTPKRLVFTTSNFATPQSVAVTADEDGDKNGDRTVTIVHTLSTRDSDYAQGRPESVEVDILDDELIDLSVINRNLQASVEVTRKDGDNQVTWKLPNSDVDLAGVQIWRTGSPFTVIASWDNDTIEYVREEFKDAAGKKDAKYVVTAYVAKTLEGGFFGPSDKLSSAAGYQGQSEEELEELGASTPEDDDNTMLIVGIVLALLIIAIIVIIIVLVARKKRDDEWDEMDDGRDDPHAEAWRQAGWQVEPEPKQPLGPSKQTDWEDEWEPVDEPGGSEPAAEDTAWPAETDAWEPTDDRQRETERSEAREEPWRRAGWSIEDSWSEETPPETFHLNCPKCHADFTATGQRPLHTTCPSCGVHGTLR